jgi:quercetin dioxygenase-like cupin family protein
MMKIQRAGSVPSVKGTADQFTGTVRRDPLLSSEAPGRLGVNLVTFEPGGRTAWHTHPAGQILIIMSGRGWAQCEGGPREEVAPGDCVWFPAGIRHWHGATDTTAMSHFALTESLGGTGVTWLEQVTDAQYLGG